MSTRPVGAFLTGRRGSLQRRFTILLLALSALLLALGLVVGRTVLGLDASVRTGVVDHLAELTPAYELEIALLQSAQDADASPAPGDTAAIRQQAAAAIDAQFSQLLGDAPSQAGTGQNRMREAYAAWHDARATLLSAEYSKQDYRRAIGPVVGALASLRAEAQQGLQSGLVEAEAQTRQGVIAVVLGVLGCIALIGLLARLVRRGVLLPLRALRRATTTLGENRQVQPLALVSSNDEMGSLAHALSDAADRLKAAVAQARQLGESDATTGLLNKAEFERRLRSEVSRSRRYGHDMAVVFCRCVAAEDGSELTEAEMRTVADICSAVLRPSDLLARTGSAEIGMLLPETHRGGALIAIRRLRRHAALSFGDARLEIGLSCYPDESETTRDLLALARQVLDQGGVSDADLDAATGTADGSKTQDWIVSGQA